MAHADNLRGSGLEIGALMSTAPLPSQPIYAKPKKAVGPRLKILLMVVFGLTALLVANSAYMLTITAQGFFSGHSYENWFYLWMFMAHVVLGLLLVGPLVLFGIFHMINAWNHKKRRAVKLGYVLFVCSLVVLATGILLTQVSFSRDPKSSLIQLRSTSRGVVYWAHVITPFVAAWLYWLHRLAGTRIKWKLGLSYGSAVAAACLAMVFLHSQDPRKWGQVGPKEGEKYFFPSLARTATGNFIPADTLMMDNYCLKCHEDNYKGWFHSSHHFSSFNNPAYLAAVRETREFSMKKDTNVRRSRWCAGCHDQVPFFSGAFDDPNFDDVKHPTS
jgi:hypothetical protein